MGYRADDRARTYLTESLDNAQKLSYAAPTELSCTLVSYVAASELCCVLLSYAALSRAMLHFSEQSGILLSFDALF